MRGFEANNCRLCVKVFCCEKCRKQHESKVHQVVPECDLCVYGQFSFITIDDTLLLHIKSSHLPLKCLYCFKHFTSIEEVVQRKKCSVAYLRHSKEDSPKTPFKQPVDINANDQDSPILNELQSKEDFHHFINLATSTPMQRTQEQKLMAFDKSNKEPITPVDRLDKPININKSIIKKANSLVKCDSSSKRRVTFGEPSECNSAAKAEGERAPENENKNCDEDKNSEVKDSTPDKTEFYSTATPSSASNRVVVKEEQFYSAKSVIQSSTSINEKAIKKEIVADSSSSTPVCAPSTSRLRSRNENPSSSVQGSNNEAVPLTVPVPPLENPSQTSDEDRELKKPESEVLRIEDSSPEIVNPNVTNDLKNSPKENLTEPEEKQCNEESLLKTNDSKEDSNKENYPVEEAQTPHGKTLWMSALSPTDALNEKDEDKESPPKEKANLLVPTPIMKRTDIQMKFSLPSHFASTPIMSTGLVKLRQTEMIENVTTKVMEGHPTPFKTPQGRIFSLSRVSALEPFDTQPGQPSQSTAQYSEVKLVPDSSSEETYPLEKSTDGVSVSSMTESSLWSSMTRVMKSVYESFTSKSLEDQPISNKSMSIKRQISEPDADVDFLEGPRLKRFKFTDIKCRRPIRASRALVPTTSLNRPVASLEIIKSVSMFYKGPKLQCDKATQTDDYLMYGFEPSS